MKDLKGVQERQVKINFEPIEHKYTDETGLEYTSATTLIGKYKPPFNKRYWSMYTALKNSGVRVRPDHGNFKSIFINGAYRSLDWLYSNPINTLEVKELVDKWARLTKAACDRGNEVHDFLEDSINESKGDSQGLSNNLITPQFSLQGDTVTIKTKHDLDLTTIGDRYPKIYDALLWYIKKGCTIFAEKRIYSTTYQIAGMIDVLIVKGRSFAIMDWKTNKDKMHFVSGYYKKIKVGGEFVKGDEFVRTYKTLFHPVDNLEDCKGIIYSLQLSLYAYIMELWGSRLVKDGLNIFHIRPGLSPKLIPIKYYRSEIQAILEHHRDTRILNKAPKNTVFGIKG